MGALDELIVNARRRPELDDVWHRKIAEARACNPPVSWPEIVAAVAKDTGTAPLPLRTLQTWHDAWRQRQG